MNYTITSLRMWGGVVRPSPWIFPDVSAQDGDQGGACLLVPQSIDRMEEGSFPGRIIAEKDAHEH